MVRAVSLLVLVASIPAVAAPAYRVIDRYPGRSIVSSEPSFIVMSSGLLIGSAADPANGRELWVSDGTAAGTRIVRDIRPGPLDSVPDGLVELNGVVYFVAADTDTRDSSAYPRALWRTDGTTTGTWRVKSLARSRSFDDGVGAPTVLDGRLLLLAGDMDGMALWRSDGTPDGTTRVVGFPEFRAPDLDSPVVFAGRLYFTADDGTELWASDGTASGTVLVFTWGSGLDGSSMTVSDGWLYFAAADSATGQELWHSNGTPSGTAAFVDLQPGPAGSNPSNLTDVGGALFFSTSEPSGLWRTDGTPAGTIAIHDRSGSPLYVPGPAAALGDTLIFVAGDAHGWEPWAVGKDSTSARMLRDIAVGPDWSAPRDLYAHGERMYFSAATAGGRGLWCTDGTEAGTQPLADGGLWGVTPSSPPGFASAGNLLYLAASYPGSGAELWVTDGSTPGTRMVANLAADADGAGLGRVAALPGLLMFGGSGSLWRSDGWAAGTYALPLIEPEEIVAVGSQALVRARDAGTGGYWVYVSDGTAGGTRRLERVEDLGWRDPGRLTAAGDAAYFVASDALVWTDTGLFRSDGSEAGTELVVAPVRPDRLAAVGDRLFFSEAQTGEVWRTQSSGPGLVRIAAFPWWATSAGYFRSMGDTLVFIADDGISGLELWRSDGDEAGTARIADICSGFCSAFGGYPYPAETATDFATGAGALFFLADDRVHGRELWRSDGTTAGTWLVADLAPGPDSAAVRLLGVLGNMALFSLDEGEGPRLWSSDGTVAGTHRVGGADDVLVPADGWFVTSGGLGYLAAADPSRGLEPWVTDGATASLLVDLAPGSSSSSPAEAALVGPRLFFSADDGVSGRDLWAAVLRPPRPARVVVPLP